MTEFAAYAGLFGVAFLAATIFPAQSEAVLAGMLLSDRYSVAALLAVATVGNVLGAVVNWLLGRGIERFRDWRWFPASAVQLERARRWYARYGRWSLLLSWLPIGGDALTVIAGVLREPLWSFVAIVTIAKAGRYLALAAVTEGLL
ncbi:MAG TPA: YqaA family protein [Rhizobiaceae bacterium]|nr:YqaA family protein [Rhizobiaceae bacterium]